MLPANATRISEIACFEPPNISTDGTSLPENAAIPSSISLKSGATLTNIHRVILCTGYQFSFPFMPQYHSDGTPVTAATDTTLVTDGTQLHNLHNDIFYIPDPTLAFVGVPFYTATFSLFEFQARAVAAVFAGRAFLPRERQMREAYRRRSERKGFGRRFHSLKEEEVEYVRELVAWLNRDAVEVGAAAVEGHTVAWHTANRERIKQVRERAAAVERDGALGVSGNDWVP